jgi:FhaA, N-terminal domain/FHA domain
MSVLRAIETRIEGLFEGVFGRAFRTHVQPVELARKLAKEMDEHRSVSVSRVYVPNEYTVYLSPGDRTQFAPYEGSLVGELQEYLTEHARREAYATLTPPRVLLQTDEDLAIGEFGIATRVAQPDEVLPHDDGPPERVSAPSREVRAPVPVPPPAESPAVTVVYGAGEALPVGDDAPEDEPEAEQEQVTLTVAGRVVPVSGGRVVVGRSRECDIRVDDGNVSRRHFELVREGSATWVVVDLGSTNGTEVNGRKVQRRTPLDDGDRITIGSTELLFERAVR